MKFYSSFERSPFDIESINDVLESGFVSRGPVNQKFEGILSDSLDSLPVLSNSGTSSLLTALYILTKGISNASVWTSPINFCSVAHVCSFIGSKLSYIDINPYDFNICIDTLKSKLSQASITGDLPDVLVVIHLGGVLQNMQEIHALSNEYGFKVVEDACHAFGNRYPCGSPVGSCCFSDVTVFSFHALKTISSGEGGLLTTKSSVLHTQALQFSTLALLRGSEEEPWVVESQLPALNFRMSDISASLAISQYSDLEKRRLNRISQLNCYLERLDSNYLCLQRSYFDHSLNFRHLIIAAFLTIDSIEKKLSVYKRCLDSGIRLSVHYKPIYKHQAFFDSSFSNHLPNTEDYYLKSFTLPSSLNLTSSDLSDCIDTINTIARSI